MNDVAIIVWGLSVCLSTTILMHYCFQALDFSKLFKPNSTFQIRVIILFLSLICGIVCALGVCLLLNSIANL